MKPRAPGFFVVRPLKNSFFPERAAGESKGLGWVMQNLKPFDKLRDKLWEFFNGLVVGVDKHQKSSLL